MPPKQKQQKKGPTYKNSIPPKDMVPVQIKQNPRQPKAIKAPQVFAEPSKNSKLQNLFQIWPSQQILKSHDFGISSQKRYEDPFHEQISSYIKNTNLMHWKSIHEIDKLKQNKKIQNQKQESDNENSSPRSHSNFESGIQHDVKQKKDIVVISTFLRDQSEQQIQKRLSEEAQKAEKAAKDKKKGKKQEVKQQGPIKISDVQMKDIVVNKNTCDEGVWIGSQLQIIKLRKICDAYTKEPVWKKIYPQQNGVPKLTKSGKYWVKLYYMGQAVKIQVDDRMPISFNIKQMFPLSENQNQQWTQILSKALIKLMAKVKSNTNFIGNGLILYALTGMISQTLSLQHFKDWQTINSYLNDQHYINKDILLSCYSQSKNKSPSNYLRNPNQVKDFLLLQNSNFKNTRSRKNSANELNLRQSIEFQKQQYVENQVIGGYAYCLGDCFQNGQFNMAFSKQRSQKQNKLRHEYIELSKVSLSTKTRQQKLQHRKKKKQIKQLLAIEEKKRSEMINKDTSSYNFVKILSDIKIHCQFTQRQILLAKKCVLNKLNQPPNYQMPTDKQQNKSIKSFSLIKTTKQQVQVNPDITDFSVLQNSIDLLTRPQKGIWIKSVDFITTFSEMQIIYNPAASIFANKKIQTVQSQAQDQYTFDQNKQILVVQKAQKLKQEDDEIENINLLFGFSYQESKQDTLAKPFCMLQKFDFNTFGVTSTQVKLNQIVDSKLINLKNQNNVFKIHTMSKGNFNYHISCSSSFKLMSLGEYLQQFEGYKKQTFSIQYPAFEAKNYFCLSKLKIKQLTQTKNSIVVKVNSTVKNLIKGLTYKLVKVPQQGKTYTNEQQEGIIQKNNQLKFLSEQYTKIKIQANSLYYLVVQCSALDNIQQGTLQLIVYAQNQTIQIINLEQVESTKFIQKYIPNKYGLIFRQRIFSNIQNCQSLFIKLVQGEQGQGTGSQDKKNQKKGSKDEPSMQIIEKPLLFKRNIILRVIKNNQTIYQTRGFNQLTLSNINFPNIKNDPNNQYILEARFDLLQWPEAKKENQETLKMYWLIVAFGTDSIALVRDTKQEQKQKQTKKSWEDKEPGRAQRAKKSRKKFLIQLKKQNGQQLTQEESLILSAPRMTKKQQLEQDKKNEQKNKKGGKKQDKKGAKQVKKQQIEEKVERQFPKSDQNCMCQIKQFLKTLENFEVHYKARAEDQQAKIRSEEQLSAIKESSQMSRQNRVGKLIRNIQKRQTINIKEKDKKDHLSIYLEENTSQFKQNWSKYIQWRNQDLEKDKLKQQKERSIIDIVNQEKVTFTQADINKIINQYKQINGYNQNLANVATMVRKNLKINALNQKVSGLLIGWEVEQLKLIKEQVQKQKISLQQTLVKNIDEMLQQAQKNPALVTEKQYEAKKGKKGGKK